MTRKLDKEEKLIYEGKKIGITNRNLTIKSKPFFTERIMLGDIRKWRLEKDKIVISIMKKAKLRTFLLDIPITEIKCIFEKMEESIKECKKVGYRKTTSWYWEDLVGESEEILEIFSKKSISVLIFDLLIGGFFLVLFIGTLIRGKLFIGKVEFLAVIFGFSIFLIITVTYLGGLFNLQSKLIVLSNSFIIKGTLISKKIYFNKSILESFLLNSKDLLFMVPAPTRYFFSIVYLGKNYSYPTCSTLGFPLRLGKQKYEDYKKIIMKYKESEEE